MNESQKGKCKKLPTKSVLFSPYKYSWPLVDVDVENQIINKLLLILPCLKPKISWKDKRQKEDYEMTEIVKKRKHIRSLLAVGINEITRALEKDMLDVVLVSRTAEPPMITKHLIPLVCARQCPSFILNSLSVQLAPALGLKSLVGLGFKKSFKQEEKVFDDAIQFMQSKAPVMSLPWLQQSKISSSDIMETDMSLLHCLEEHETSPSEDSLEDHSSVECDITNHNEVEESCRSEVPVSKDSQLLNDKSVGSISENIRNKNLPLTEHITGTDLANKSATDYSYLYVYKTEQVKQKRIRDFIPLDADDFSTKVNAGKRPFAESERKVKPKHHKGLKESGQSAKKPTDASQDGLPLVITGVLGDVHDKSALQSSKPRTKPVTKKGERYISLNYTLSHIRTLTPNSARKTKIKK